MRCKVRRIGRYVCVHGGRQAVSTYRRVCMHVCGCVVRCMRQVDECMDKQAFGFFNKISV